MVYVRLPGSGMLTPPSPVDGERTDFWHTVQISRCGLNRLRRNRRRPLSIPAPRQSSTRGRNHWSGRDPDHPALSDLHHLSGQGLEVHDRSGIIDGLAIDLDPSLLDEPPGLGV
jgi:hypothetical protein